MLSAADLLREAEVDSVAVGDRVGVDPRTVPVRIAPWWMRAAWAQGTAALTAPWVIWVAPDVMAWESRRRASLIIHELAHSGQWRRLGTLPFLTRYLLEYGAARFDGKGHKEAYRKLSLEQEAEAVRRDLLS